MDCELVFQLKKSCTLLDIIITKQVNQSVILTNLRHAPVPTTVPYINFLSAHYVLLVFWGKFILKFACSTEISNITVLLQVLTGMR
jgi:hypothetical protein